MRIILATPLYPPDIAPPAPYVQELARRLSSEHSVVIAAYGRFVEPIPDVEVIAIDKRHSLPFRLIGFFIALTRASRHADVIYMENGPSVELPGILASLLTRTPLVFHLGDAKARARSGTNAQLRFLERLTRARARVVIETVPIPRPEIIPFLPYPTKEEAAYEQSWSSHLEDVDTALHHD